MKIAVHKKTPTILGQILCALQIMKQKVDQPDNDQTFKSEVELKCRLDLKCISMFVSSDTFRGNT